MNKISFNTKSLISYELKDALKEIEKAGYDGAEIYLKRTQLNPYTTTEEELADLKQYIEGLDLKVTCLDTTDPCIMTDAMNLPSLVSAGIRARTARLQFYKGVIDLAKKLGIPAVIITSGPFHGKDPDYTGKPEDFYKEAFHDEDGSDIYLMSAFEALADYAGDIELWLEPTPGFYINTIEKALYFINGVNKDNFKLLLSIPNVVSGEHNEVLNQGFVDIAKYVANIHFADVRAQVFYHKIPGEGTADLIGALDRINAMGYKGYVGIDLARCEEPDELKQLSESKAFVAANA